MDKPTLLLVDDEPRILRSLAMIFRQDYRILTAENGLDALNLFQNESIDVVLSDQRMPKMTGSELLREVRKRSPHTMRLLLTGYSDLRAIINSINDGEVFRFINKPWDKQKLVETVEKAASLALASKQISSKPDHGIQSKIPNFMVLDKDEATHEMIKGIIGNQAKVFHHYDLSDAIDTLTREQIAILIADIKLENDDISHAINLLKQENPELITIVMTEYTDTNQLVDLINYGQIYRFLPKPARKGILIQSIKSGLKNYRTRVHQPALIKRTETESFNEQQKSKISMKLMEKIRMLRKRFREEHVSV